LPEEKSKSVKAVHLIGIDVNLQPFGKLTVKITKDRGRVVAVRAVLFVIDFCDCPIKGDRLTGLHLLAEHLRPSGIELALCGRRRHSLKPLSQFQRERFGFAA
jgi:hypothetical protein